MGAAQAPLHITTDEIEMTGKTIVYVETDLEPFLKMAVLESVETEINRRNHAFKRPPTTRQKDLR